MDNTKQAPVIPSGTNNMAGGAYNPLAASQTMAGQAHAVPVGNQVAVQTPQTNEETSPQGQAFQELAAKKGWTSPDDMARAYEESEKAKTRAEMSLSELIKIRTEMQPVEEESVVDTQPVQSQQDAIRVVERIIDKKVRPLKDQIQLQTLFLKYPDAGNYAEAMGLQIRENPGLSWESAYKLAKFDTVGPKAKEEGKQEAYQTIAQKQSVAVEPSSPTAAKDQMPLDQMVRDRNIPFSEVQKIMRERFSQ